MIHARRHTPSATLSSFTRPSTRNGSGGLKEEKEWKEEKEKNYERQDSGPLLTQTGHRSQVTGHRPASPISGRQAGHFLPPPSLSCSSHILLLQYLALELKLSFQWIHEIVLGEIMRKKKERASRCEPVHSSSIFYNPCQHSTSTALWVYKWSDRVHLISSCWS